MQLYTDEIGFRLYEKGDSFYAKDNYKYKYEKGYALTLINKIEPILKQEDGTLIFDVSPVNVLNIEEVL